MINYQVFSALRFTNICSHTLKPQACSYNKYPMFTHAHSSIHFPHQAHNRKKQNKWHCYLHWFFTPCLLLTFLCLWFAVFFTIDPSYLFYLTVININKACMKVSRQKKSTKEPKCIQTNTTLLYNFGNTLSSEQAICFADADVISSALSSNQHYHSKPSGSHTGCCWLVILYCLKYSTITSITVGLFLYNHTHFHPDRHCISNHKL